MSAETETTLKIETATARAVTVTRYRTEDGPTDLFLTIRDLEGPRDQEHGSARLTAQQAEPIAHALLGIDDHHDLDAYASRVMGKHRRDCHDGAIDDSCIACRTACGTQGWSLADIAFLRARWADVKPYDQGGLLDEPYSAVRDPERARRLGALHYRVEADGGVTDNDPNRYTGWHVHTGGKAPAWLDDDAKAVVDAWLKVTSHPELAEECLDYNPEAGYADAVCNRITELGEIARRAERAETRLEGERARADLAEAQLANLKVAARLAGVVMHSDWNTAAPTETVDDARERDRIALKADRDHWRDSYRELLDTIARRGTVTIDDRAPAYTVTEAEIDAVEVVKHTTARSHETIIEWHTERRTVLDGETPERLRESVTFHLQSVAELEAVARAMEEDN